MAQFGVTILKPVSSPPRFPSRPAFILLITTSGLIRMETMFHPEMGPVLQPHWGRGVAWRSQPSDCVGTTPHSDSVVLAYIGFWVRVTCEFSVHISVLFLHRV